MLVKESSLTSLSRNRRHCEARQVITWLAMKTNYIMLTELGKRFGREVTTFSRVVRQVE